MWHCGCYVIWNNPPAPFSGRAGRIQNQGAVMTEQSVRLGPREQQIVELLLQGCDNAEIANHLKMATRTVKAHVQRSFLRFGINRAIKRAKLAASIYRR